MGPLRTFEVFLPICQRHAFRLEGRAISASVVTCLKPTSSGVLGVMTVRVLGVRDKVLQDP